MWGERLQTKEGKTTCRDERLERKSVDLKENVETEAALPFVVSLG